MVSDTDIGLVGLGVMGRNLALNFADHGFRVAGYDTDSEKVDALNADSDKGVRGYGSMSEMVAALKKPRALLMLVPAGKAVDAVIGASLPHLEEGDLIIDAGNSKFSDTDRRVDQLAPKGVHFMGVGVSGGEKGAREGPSMMPGGLPEDYERVKPIFEAAAAHVNGVPCVTYLGKRSAGHYVKMVHNGIEYALMQLIAETYDLMKLLLGFDNDKLGQTYGKWNQEELSSYLVQITAEIFAKEDSETPNRLIDVILDRARQKGTGRWTSQDAMDLKVPTPTIDMAVCMRQLSGFKELRGDVQKRFGSGDPSFHGDGEELLHDIKYGLYASMLLSYAQGMALLSAASAEYGYGLSLQDVAHIWRGGCIIRAGVLDDIYRAYNSRPDLPIMILDPEIAGTLQRHIPSLRRVVRAAVEAEIPAPALAVSLAYFDAFRRERLPANLIQAQRDYFGSHTYERLDKDGTFHTVWDD